MSKVSPKTDYVTSTEFNSAVTKVGKRLDNLDNSVGILKNSFENLQKSVGKLKESVGELKNSVMELKDSVGTLKNSVFRIEERLGFYGDMYEINKWHAEKLANRVSKLEKHSGITPPQDFLISGI